MLVTKRALVRCGSPEIPRFCIAAPFSVRRTYERDRPGGNNQKPTNHIGGSGRGPTARIGAAQDGYEFGVVVGDDNACAESTADEKDTEPPVDRLKSSLDVDARAFGFGRDHGDILRTDNTKGGRPEGT